MDIEIFPHRVLGSDTTEKLLNDLESIEDVRRTVIHGPRFPKTEETLPPQYRERRVINVNGEDVVLQVKTGRIFVELTLESTIDEIEEICNKHIPSHILILHPWFEHGQRCLSPFLVSVNLPNPNTLLSQYNQVPAICICL